MDPPPTILVSDDKHVKGKGGRPLGTSKTRKQEHSLALLAAKNEITSEYKLEIDKSLVKQMKKVVLLRSSVR